MDVDEKRLLRGVGVGRGHQENKKRETLCRAKKNSWQKTKKKKNRRNSLADQVLGRKA